ncbi:MAG: glutathione S-transferase family protein [Proteobacteria bacterium]|nr:glutathione S-transferase family protein [Pseudomonadota bacterium]
MKLYDFPGAPNPRRVKIFAAEKDIVLELVNVNLAGREHKDPDFLQKSPSGKIPVLELDDGRCIAESIAISRYLESLVPEPNLFGRDAFETAQIEMQHRFIELELFAQVGISWVNGPIVAKMGLVDPIEAAKQRSDGLVKAYYQRLNTELAQRDYIAGDRFTIADISGVCCIDFASAMVGLKPADDLTALAAWLARVHERPGLQSV